MNWLFAELKRRGVLKVATAYLVVSWLVLEVGNTLFVIFDLPPAGMRILFALLALGFPIAVGIAWRYRLAVSAELENPAERPHGGGHEQTLAAVFAVVAVAVIGIVIVMRFTGYERADAARAAPAATAVGLQPAGAPASGAAAEPFTPPERSIAVMSFVNMSGDPSEEYFSDGLSEELLNSLARIEELRVAARTSSFSFKGTATDVPTIGRKLNVAAVLEGSVRKSGSRVRITAQLIDTSNGYHLWSDNFDRDLTDILALQTEIATAVTHALKLELLGDLATKLRYGSTENAAAYDAYLRGLALMKQRSGEANDRASLAAFDEAVRLDPAFALAHAAGAVMIASVAVDWTVDYTEFKRLGDEARLRARRAIALAPELGAVHEAEVIVIDRTSSLDFAAARSAARRAMELEPGNVAVLTSHALVEGRLGRSAAALESAARAIALDPLSDRAWRMQGIQLYYAHRHDEARRSLQQALALQPGQRVTNAWIALNDLVSGEIDAAIEVCATDESWNGRQCLAIAYHKSERHAEADELLQRLKMEFGDTLAYQYAEIHAQRGETEPALEWLRTAVRVMDPGLGDLKVNPLLDPLRATPGFKEIEASLGFPLL